MVLATIFTFIVERSQKNSVIMERFYFISIAPSPVSILHTDYSKVAIV